MLITIHVFSLGRIFGSLSHLKNSVTWGFLIKKFFTYSGHMSFIKSVSPRICPFSTLLWLFLDSLQYHANLMTSFTIYVKRLMKND